MSLICVVIVVSGSLDRFAGIILLGFLLLYLVEKILLERRRQPDASQIYVSEAETITPFRAKAMIVFLAFVVGLVLAVLGAKAVVGGAVSIAAGLGVSEAVIGLTVVAIGTSLPELVTSVLAAREGQSDVAFGNVIGNNIFNVLGILGVTAIVRPLEIPQSIAAFDIWVMLAATVLLFLVTMTGWRISRREGLLLLSAFGSYILYNVALASPSLP